MKMESGTLSRISLKSGQTLRTYVEAGTQLVISSGVVEVIDSPQWLRIQFVTAAQLLHEGDEYIVGESGWIALHASRCVQVRLFAPGRKSLSETLREFIASLQKRFLAQAGSR